MTVVIAGGSGFLGRALTRALRDHGHRVRVLTRTPRDADDVRWSTDDRDREWTGVIEGAGAVVNLAGENIAARRWTSTRRAAILRSRIRTTRALAAAIAAARTPPLVLLSGSAVGIYGTHGDDPLTEESPLGSDYLADVCKRWESEAAGASGVTRVVLLRTGLVLSRQGGALPQMARPFQFFAGGRLGSGRQYVSWIHLADWVAMVGWAMHTATVEGPLNVTAPQPVTNAEFSGALGRAMRRPAWLPAPGFALRLMLGDMADALLLGGQRVVPERARHLGFAFRHPALEEALQALFRG